MIPQTIGHSYDVGRIAHIQCVKDDTFKDLNIKDSCYLMAIIHKGTANFKVGKASFEATGPCIVCFDETESPILTKKRGVKCDSIYFVPTFLNINMTFARIHEDNYEHLADAHDFFLLKPFTDKECYVYPMFDENAERFAFLFASIESELAVQPDWYWSCRSRSYFMEIMLMLERTYGLVEQNTSGITSQKKLHPHLRNAILFIESNYQNTITLKDISASAALNHSTLTEIFKNDLGMTPVEYLWHHRLVVAKKFLEFTNLQIKDIAKRCGFKTVQHFSRKFEENFGCNPSDFRCESVAKRKLSFNNNLTD